MRISDWSSDVCSSDLGALAILAAAALLSWQGSAGGLGLGALAIAGACLAWGIDNNLTRKISGADPMQIAMLKGLVAGSVNLGLAVLLGAHLPEPGVQIGRASCRARVCQYV